MADFDLYEFPADHVGRKTYVSVRGHSRSIPKCYTYRGTDGRNYIHPDFGGDWSGYPESAAYVIGDIGEYVSVVDGSVISSRSQHRDHLRAHELVEVGNERMPTPRPEIRTTSSRETAQALYRHLDSVRRMPEQQYREHINRQRYEMQRD